MRPTILTALRNAIAPARKPAPPRGLRPTLDGLESRDLKTAGVFSATSGGPPMGAFSGVPPRAAEVSVVAPGGNRDGIILHDSTPTHGDGASDIPVSRVTSDIPVSRGASVLSDIPVSRGSAVAVTPTPNAAPTDADATIYMATIYM